MKLKCKLKTNISESVKYLPVAQNNGTISTKSKYVIKLNTKAFILPHECHINWIYSEIIL